MYLIVKYLYQEIIEVMKKGLLLICILLIAIQNTQAQCNLQIVETITNVSCYGGNNGAINITVSNGIEPYTYVWTNSFNQVDTTQDISNKQAGVYTLQVIDSLGCLLEQFFVIQQPLNLLSVQAITLSDPLCLFSDDGMVTATASGGTPPYTYNWTQIHPSNQIIGVGQTQTNLYSGTYCVVVEDANGCESTQSCTSVAFYSPGPNFNASPTIQNVSCNGGNDG